ncbi:MAG: GreA/GreB family elongation factor, partial [Patescibacteria group bacterium]
MQVPWRRSDKFKKVDDGPVYITEEGLKNLKEKLVHLKKILPGYIAEAKRTAAYGDRSDNAEYKQAKGMLRRTNYQILEIEGQLKRVSVISSKENTSGVVQLGSTVILKTQDGKEKTFQLVGPMETNPGGGRISHESPLGSALLK